MLRLDMSSLDLDVLSFKNTCLVILSKINVGVEISVTCIHDDVGVLTGSSLFQSFERSTNLRSTTALAHTKLTLRPFFTHQRTRLQSFLHFQKATVARFLV